MKFFHRPGFVVASALLVLLVLSWADVFPLHRIVLFYAQKIIAPIYRGTQSLPSSLEAENAALRALIRDRLTKENDGHEKTTRDTLEKSMEEWSAIRGMPTPIIADVLVPFNDGARQSLLLNRGKRNGVREGMAVYTEQGILVGKITDVREATALLTLTTSRGERFSVVQYTSEESIGVVEGNGDGLPTLLFAPKELSLKSYETLLTSGLDQGVPYGLIVGTILDATPADTSPWQHVTVMPPFHRVDLHRVAIIALEHTL